MEIYKIYESLIIETEITSCVKKFGYELFGHELGGKERNTGLENNYVRDISDFTDNRYGEETTPEFMKALGTLKGCIKQYPEVLIPEKTSVFRGLTIPARYFIDKGEPITLNHKFPYVYKARNEIQSWSTNSNAASTFGNHDTVNEIAAQINFSLYQTPEARQELLKKMIAEDLRIAFVIEYTTNSKEFMFKSKYFKLLSMAHHEDELIRIDNKPIRVMAKFNDHQDVFLTGKGLALIKYINKAIEEAKLFTKSE
jgi:hypothetical protein